MVVVHPGVLIRTRLGEAFVIGSGTAAGHDRGCFPFRIERSANSSEQTVVGVEWAETDYRGIEGGNASNPNLSTRGDARSNAGIDAGVRIPAAIVVQIRRRSTVVLTIYRSACTDADSKVGWETADSAS